MFGYGKAIRNHSVELAVGRLIFAPLVRQQASIVTSSYDTRQRLPALLGRDGKDWLRDSPNS